MRVWQMPFQLSQCTKQSLELSPLGKSYKHFMLSDMMKLYYKTVARNIMIKYYILAGTFIIKLQFFTSTLSRSDGSRPLLRVIEKSSLRRKPCVRFCVFVNGQGENGSHVWGQSQFLLAFLFCSLYPSLQIPMYVPMGRAWIGAQCKKVIMGNEQKPNKVHLDWLVSLGKVAKLSLCNVSYLFFIF